MWNLIATAAMVALLAGWTRANADLPPLPNITVPALVPVVSTDGAGTADPAGEITIEVRDLANLPVANSHVILDFSGCPGVRFCADPADPAAIVNCANARVLKVTDLDGVVRFRVVGSASALPGPPIGGSSGLIVYCDGVISGFPRVVTYDLDGGGLSPSDLSLWLTEIFGAASDMRCDYDGSGTLGPNDLSLWLQVYFANGSLAGCPGGATCP